jgi:hypothetical protein
MFEQTFVGDAKTKKPATVMSAFAIRTVLIAGVAPVTRLPHGTNLT